MKKYIMSFVCLAAVFCALGCDDEPGTSLPGDGSPVDNARQLLCEDSGGTFANGLCTCGSLVCAENVFCHKDGKGCAGVQAPITSEEMKKQLCEDSGGTFANSLCTCNGTACAENIFSCKDENGTLSCGDEQTVQMPETCVVIEDGGEKMAYVYSTQTASMHIRTCPLPICNSAGTDCGCEAASTRCIEDAGSYQQQICQADGTWSHLKTCDLGCGQSHTVCAECTGETATCETVNGKATMRTCSDGKWQDVVCERGICNPEATACGCNTGDYKCDNIDGESLYSICNQGNWQATPCENVSCGPNGKCGECLNNDIVCKSEHDYESVCINGVYVKENTCETTSCAPAQKQCGECKNGDVKCENVDGVATSFTCIDGLWNTEPCPNPTFCNTEGTQCVECIDGETTCVNYKNWKTLFTEDRQCNMVRQIMIDFATRIKSISTFENYFSFCDFDEHGDMYNCLYYAIKDPDDVTCNELLNKNFVYASEAAVNATLTCKDGFWTTPKACLTSEQKLNYCASGNQACR